MDNDRLVAISEVIGDKRRNHPGFIPQSKSKFYADVKAGVYGPLIKMGKRSNLRLSTINKVIDKAATE